jgi:tetratricopeptide (TPR) repeat protein/predicted phosphodiesterase
MQLNRPLVAACAAAMLLSLLTSASGDVAADHKRAMDLYAASRFVEAAEALRAVLPHLQGQQAVDAQYKLAYVCLRAFKNNEAITEFNRLLAMPDVPTRLRGVAHYQIGVANALQRKFNEAIAAYHLARQEPGVDDEEVALSWLFEGHALKQLAKDRESIAAYESAAAVAGAHFVTRQTAYTSAGAIHQLLEEYQEAIKCFEAAIALSERSQYAELAHNRIIECRTAMEGSDAFYIAPYVVRVSQTTADLHWVSRREAPSGTLELRLDGSADSEPARFTAVRREFNEHRAFRQAIRMDNLKPGTRYAYRALCGQEVMSGTFLTAPDDHRPIRFSVIGDTQGGHEDHRHVAHDIAQQNPDFVIHVGDCVERGDRWDEWKVQMFDPGVPYLSKAMILPARGNHDGGHTFPIFFGRDERVYEDYRFGDVHVFIMDSQSSTGGHLRNRQIKWLTDGLSQTDARWKIVALHHPMMHSPATEPLFGQSDFLPILEEHGVDVVLTGHYHVYQRLLPIGAPGKKPILHITSGGGGGTMGARTMSPLVVRDDKDNHHSLLFEVEGDTLRMVARTPDGKELDRISVRHEGKVFDAAVMARAVSSDLAKQARLLYNLLTHPSVQRHDFVAAPHTPPAPNAFVTFTLRRHLLDPARVPPGSVLRLEQAPGSGWTIATQTIDLLSDAWTFQATAPASLTSGRLETMRMRVRLVVDDFEFEPEVVAVTFEAPLAAAP